MAREFALIDAIRRRATSRPDVLLGIGDDAAVLRPTAGCDLVVAMDTLNADVHFPHDTAPGAIGWKALAVNLSDLAAMGATPAWCTLSLSLPDADAGWVEAFLDGFLDLASRYDVALVGGDTTRGPLSVCVTAHGWVQPTTALRRDGAGSDDDIWVTGTLGDAAGALVQWRNGIAVDGALRDRLDRPQPRVAFGDALRGIASACIDVSDGLLADLGHLCSASGRGATVEIDALPISAALRRAFDGEQCRQLTASGGDDYELCFTAPVAMRGRIRELTDASDLAVTPIGCIAVHGGVQTRRADGAAWHPDSPGYAHFEQG